MSTLALKTKFQLGSKSVVAITTTSPVSLTIDDDASVCVITARLFLKKDEWGESPQQQSRWSYFIRSKRKKESQSFLYVPLGRRELLSQTRQVFLLLYAKHKSLKVKLFSNRLKSKHGIASDKPTGNNNKDPLSYSTQFSKKQTNKRVTNNSDKDEKAHPIGQLHFLLIPWMT